MFGDILDRLENDQESFEQGYIEEHELLSTLPRSSAEIREDALNIRRRARQSIPEDDVPYLTRRERGMQVAIMECKAQYEAFDERKDQLLEDYGNLV